jgi:hypothetical protein
MAAPLDFRDAEIGPGWKSGFTHNYSAFRTASRIARLPTRSQPGSHMSPVRSPLFNTFLMAFLYPRGLFGGGRTNSAASSPPTGSLRLD